MYFCYPEFWGKYDGNRRNKLIGESIFIRSTWNNIFFCKKIFCWAALKSFKNNSTACEKNFRLWDKNHAPFKLNGQSRTVFGLLKAPELQRLSVTVEVLRVRVMIVGVMTVEVLSVGVMTLSHWHKPYRRQSHCGNFKSATLLHSDAYFAMDRLHQIKCWYALISQALVSGKKKT